MVEILFQRCGTGRETLPKVRKWSGDPPGGPEEVGRPSLRSEVVGRPSRRSGSGRETFPEVRKWSRYFFREVELVGRPSKRSGSGRETHLEVWKWSGDSP